MSSEPTFRSRVRRWLILVAVLLVPPFVLRGCVVSTYVIRTPSMEPELLVGDHLLMLRKGVDSRPIQRWDVGIFDTGIDSEIPDHVDAIVKRIVGLPEEFLEIRRGDVFVGDRPESLEIARKPEALVRELLVSMHAGDGLTAPWSLPPGAEPGPSGGTRLPPGEESTYGATIRDGVGDEPGEFVVSDTALRVVVGEGPGALVLGLREGADIFRARLAPAERGGAVLNHNLGGGEVASLPLFRGLEPGQEVLFWNVDDRVQLFVAGRPVLSYDYEGNTAQTPGASVHNSPSLAAERGWLELRQVEVLRDVSYAPQGTYGTRPGSGLTPARINPGEVFLLGDLSHQSRDSRFFGPVSLEHHEGRPVGRYRPLDRVAWLGPTGTRGAE